jgi:hypothetical protein
MATDFPTGLDAFTNPTALDNLNTAGVVHHEQHANINDAVEALQAKVGIDGSAVTSSLDYLVDARLVKASNLADLVSASTARTNLGLGNVENTALSTWAGSANITTLGTILTGVWDGTTIAVDKGGSGQTTANDALNAFLPSQGAHSGEFLTTNGTDASWAAGGGGGTPGGSDTQVQFNDAGVFGGDSGLVFNKTTNDLTVLGAITGSNLSGTNTGDQTIPAAANPTGTIGLAAVNGSALTFLRSDGAPALSQAIAPTWTGVHIHNPAVRQGAAGVAAFHSIITPADGGVTPITASTESIGIQFGGNASKATVIRTWATGALTTQREYLFVAPTLAFAGATTVTNAATVAIDAAPIAGTNATLTNKYALWVQGGTTRLDGNKLAVGNTGAQTMPWVFLDSSAALNPLVLVVSSGSGSSGIAIGIEFNFNNGTGGNTANCARIQTMSGVGGGGTLEFLTAPSSAGAYTVKMLLGRSGDLSLTPAVRTTGSPSVLTVTTPADTTLTASTESISVNLNCSATRQFSTGALTTQRECVIQAPTYAAVGATVITNAATLAITNAPQPGTNVTITNPYALWVQAGTIRFDGTKAGFFGVTPVVKPATTGTGATGYTQNASANAVVAESTFTGNSGATAYTISDIVLALKQLGFLTA